jgi:hypothetical protein
MSTPEPFKNTGPLKAFVLGCDPTAFGKEEMEKVKRKEIKPEEREHLPLAVVFDLRVNEKGEVIGDKRYFAGIKANLEALNIEMGTIYVQNLVTEFQHYLTSEKPKKWEEEAVNCIDERRDEFHKADPTKKVPVFLTSYLLYKVLVILPKGEKLKTAAELYKTDGDVFIPAEANFLGRPLVPLFRYYKYSSKNKKEYFEKVKGELNSHIIKSV